MTALHPSITLSGNNSFRSSCWSSIGWLLFVLLLTLQLSCSQSHHQAKKDSRGISKEKTVFKIRTWNFNSFLLVIIYKPGAGNAGRSGTFLITRFGRRSDPTMRAQESRRLFKAAKVHSSKNYHSGHDDKFLSRQYHGLSLPKSQWNDNASLERHIRNPKWFWFVWNDLQGFPGL